jgi:hypothetical protein
MDILKKVFPHAFKCKKENLGGFIVTLIIYLVLAIVAGVAIGILAHIPVVNILCGLIGGLVDLYTLVGIVLSILCFLDILK